MGHCRFHLLLSLLKRAVGFLVRLSIRRRVTRLLTRLRIGGRTVKILRLHKLDPIKKKGPISFKGLNILGNLVLNDPMVI